MIYSPVFLSIFNKLLSSWGKIEEKIISSLVFGWIKPRVFACKNCLSNFEIELSTPKSIFFNFYSSSAANIGNFLICSKYAERPPSFERAGTLLLKVAFMAVFI